jgi:glycosyltransferase involved in cell wall biosynthesis
MDSPKISIITRTRNRPILLARAVESVLGQQNPPAWEWIVVNDAGDPDEVRRVLEPATNRHPDRIKLIHIPESRGMEHASNSGIRTASGDYLVIHDDDDSWEPAFLNRMCEWLDQPEHAAHAGVVCHSIRVVEEIREEGITEQFRHPFNGELREISFWRVLQENPFPPISFVFRRKAYDEAGPFDESLPVLGDWEFNLRVLARYPVGILPEALALYHHRPPSVTTDYANSITGQDLRHREVETSLRESWNKSNPFGISPDIFSAASRISPHLRKMKTGLCKLTKNVERLPVPSDPQF